MTGHPALPYLVPAGISDSCFHSRPLEAALAPKSQPCSRAGPQGEHGPGLVTARWGQKGSRTAGPHAGVFTAHTHPAVLTGSAQSCLSSKALARRGAARVLAVSARASPSSRPPPPHQDQAQEAPTRAPPPALTQRGDSVLPPAAPQQQTGPWWELPRLLLPLGCALGSWLLLPTQTTRRATTAGRRPAFYYFFLIWKLI